jgi:mannose-1-phosphate guanylyltransferase
MAGGSGTRFWPESRRRRPKQFLEIAGDRPMIRMTYERLKPDVPDEKVLLLVGRGHLEETERLFKDTKVHILAEPVGRNTAPCMGLAAHYVGRRLQSNEPIAFLPADHYIPDAGDFRRTIGRGARIAGSGGIVVLGMVPAGPATGYGYIRRGEPLADVADAFRVRAFTEKPDPETARQYLAQGDYFWNAGMFIMTPEVLLEEISQHLPRLSGVLGRLGDGADGGGFDSLLDKYYADAENISFDYGVMEKTGQRVIVLPAAFTWSDVGSWKALYELKKDLADTEGNLIEGDGAALACEGTYIAGRGKRFVACLGMKNCLVVDTPDALLVADLDKSQDIRKVVEQLKKEKKEDLL